MEGWSAGGDKEDERVVGIMDRWVETCGRQQPVTLGRMLKKGRGGRGGGEEEVEGNMQFANSEEKN